MIAVVALICGRPSRSSASVVMAAGLPDLVRMADDVAVVDVEAVASSWDARHERIYTKVDLRVVESMKGAHAPGEQVTIYQPGGTVDDITQIVVGLAVFEPGERSLVFLRGGAHRRTVVGLAQGKRAMHQDAAGRWMVLGADLAGARLVPQPGQPLPQPSGLAKLDELRVRIRDLAGAAR